MSTCLTVSDLNTTINHEPRIKDVRLAEVLRFDQPKNIRKLVTGHSPALQRFGEIAVTTEGTGPKGGRPSKVNWLNKRQALYICTKSGTSVATEVTIQMVEVFDAYTAQRNCELKQSAGNFAGAEEIEAPEMPKIVSKVAAKPEPSPAPTRSVTELYAEAAHNKSLWVNTTDKLMSDQYLASGRIAGDQLIEVPAQSIEEVILKLTEALEWMEETATSAALRLQSQAIRDLKRLALRDELPAQLPPPETPQEAWERRIRLANKTMGMTPDEVETKFPPPPPEWLLEKSAAKPETPAPQPVECSVSAAHPARPVVKIRRNARPITVDGVVYPSITAAAKATGIPYEKLRTQY